MIRRPPGSTRTDTPFPDTTLFRSAVARALGDVERGVGLREQLLAVETARRAEGDADAAPGDDRIRGDVGYRLGERIGHPPRDRRRERDVAALGHHQDRKSTRLNSSH